MPIQVGEGIFYSIWMVSALISPNTQNPGHPSARQVVPAVNIRITFQVQDVLSPATVWNSCVEKAENIHNSGCCVA